MPPIIRSGGIKEIKLLLTLNGPFPHRYMLLNRRPQSLVPPQTLYMLEMYIQSNEKQNGA